MDAKVPVKPETMPTRNVFRDVGLMVHPARLKNTASKIRVAKMQEKADADSAPIANTAGNMPRVRPPRAIPAPFQSMARHSCQPMRAAMDQLAASIGPGTKSWSMISNTGAAIKPAPKPTEPCTTAPATIAVSAIAISIGERGTSG